MISNGKDCGRKWRKRSRTRKNEDVPGKARIGQSWNERRGNKGGERRARKSKKEGDRQRKRGTFARCGGRQVSGRARFTLAYANGDILQRKGEERERERFLGAERRRERTRQDEEGLAPKKRVTGYVIPATALLFLAPEARARYPGRDERGYTEERRTSTPTYDGPSNDILLARLVTPHLPALCLSLPFLLLPACRPPRFSFSLLPRCLGSRFLVGGSQPAATSATAEQSASAELTVHHCSDHKTPLIPIDFGSRKSATCV